MSKRSHFGLALSLAVFVAAIIAISGCSENQGKPAEEVQPRDIQNDQVPRDLPKLPENIAKLLQSSVHRQLDCSDCHAPSTTTATSGRRNQMMGFVECGRCHAEQARAYRSSIHADTQNGKLLPAATCAGCHGDHDILPAEYPTSRVNKKNLAATCGGCHARPASARRLRARGADVGEHYLESIHGRLLVTQGLTVAPSCTDCHGPAHDLTRANDPRSTVSRARIAQTCGKCHRGVEEKYKTSIHAAAVAAGRPKSPVCYTCHTAHDITPPARNFKLASDRVCGQCHSGRRNRYLDTYHGKAHSLGDTRVAACYDCHGAHAIVKVSDPRSPLSAGHRVATCRKCHANATRSFAAFMPHADHTDRVHYPVLYYTFIGMTGLLVGTFGFFGIHTLLWLYRSLVLYFKDKEGFRAAKRRAREEKGARLFVRFRPIDRFCHFLIIISFLLLVATGMPLKFSQAGWAQVIFDFVGGAKAAARLHRLGAILTFSYFAIHITSLFGTIRRNREQYLNAAGKLSLRRFAGFVFGPESPAPNLQDVRDFVAHVKWFLGRGPRPSFDRFTYWEKFDYMAVFWGVSVIGLSGLVMWFPELTTRLLPGWSINVAHIVHSDEALLAAGFIFTFHFFNGHFRPEKFPIDMVMFSGRITEEEMRHERGRQYARLVASGRLDELQVKDEWPSWKRVMAPFGTVALTIGVILIIAIFWALFHRYGS